MLELLNLHELENFRFVYKLSFLSFFKMFFRALENAARLFFNLNDFVFASLVKFFFCII